MSKALPNKLPPKAKYPAKLSEIFGTTVYSFILPTHRQVAEWSKAYAWNAYVGQPTESSNLFLSAISLETSFLYTLTIELPYFYFACYTATSTSNTPKAPAVSPNATEAFLYCAMVVSASLLNA